MGMQSDDKMKYTIFFIVLQLAVFGAAFGASADEILDTVEEAVNQYTKGDYDGAANNLDFAAQLIRQKKSESLKEVFPDPLEGWEAQPPVSQATGTAVFGRSVSVNRTYRQNSSLVTIDIVSDSPVMQSLTMMLNNPVIAGAGGARLETFSGHRGVVQYNEANRSGDVNIVVADRYLVTIKGQDVDREQLFKYARAVKFAELEKK